MTLSPRARAYIRKALIESYPDCAAWTDDALGAVYIEWRKMHEAGPVYFENTDAPWRRPRT